MKTNDEVKAEAKSLGIPLWRIADELKISEPTMTRMLRHELTPEKKEQIRGIIRHLAKKDGVQNAG